MVSNNCYKRNKAIRWTEESLSRSKSRKTWRTDGASLIGSSSTSRQSKIKKTMTSPSTWSRTSMVGMSLSRNDNVNPRISRWNVDPTNTYQTTLRDSRQWRIRCSKQRVRNQEPIRTLSSLMSPMATNSRVQIFRKRVLTIKSVMKTSGRALMKKVSKTYLIWTWKASYRKMNSRITCACWWMISKAVRLIHSTRDLTSKVSWILSNAVL